MEQIFCSVKNVAEGLKISRDKSREFLNSLVEEGKLTIVYENPQIKVYAPKEVIQYIVRVRKKPAWLANHLLPNKEKHLKQKNSKNLQSTEYIR